MIIDLHHSNVLDNTSYYRALGPLLELEKKIPGMRIRTPKMAANWADVAAADVAFIHRPFTPEHFALIKKHQAFGVPVWIDYDDDFPGVAQSSSAYALITKNIPYLEACVAAADAVTVSTEALVPVYKPMRTPGRRPINVIPNALNESLFTLKKHVNLGKRVVWRGNITHDEDIYSVRASLVETARKHTDWDWIFLGGHRPYQITRDFDEHGIDYHIHPWIPDVYDYLHYLGTLQPAIVIVPLTDSRFNRAKSNIAWIEATLTGARCLAPAWHEWLSRGCANYMKPETFGGELDLMMSDANPSTDESWEYIKKNLRLSRVNTDRRDLLNDLMKEKL